MDSVVACRHLSRSFADRRVLEDVSLDVDRGDLLLILGQSGSGKSTLLSVLGALDRAFTGAVTLFGRDLGRMSERDAASLRAESIGFVFQSFHLLPHLSALDNVALPALFGARREDAVERARALLADVGLADRAGDRPSALSGGQRQRVAIARAMFARPRLLLCDEPTGNLDRATGAHIIDLLAALHVRGDTTIVVATHDERFAPFATRTLLLDDGRLIEERHAGAA